MQLRLMSRKEADTETKAQGLIHSGKLCSSPPGMGRQLWVIGAESLSPRLLYELLQDPRHNLHTRPCTPLHIEFLFCFILKEWLIVS